jgi:hypothetical protein
MPEAEPAVHPEQSSASPAQTARPAAPVKPAGNWRHPGWSWAVGRDWLIPSGVATATLLIGAALAGIPVLVSGNWHDPGTQDQAWAFLGLGLAGFAVLTLTAVVHGGRERLLNRNGTAYIIQEEAREWSHDESRGFLASAERQFARVIRVPGPGRLAGPWDWPLSDGAQYWDGKLTELVRSFQALHYDDDPNTPNGIFLWAWWPVSLALGMRVSAADRGLVLNIWQRPSRGRAGRLMPAPWAQRPHRFVHSATAASAAALAPECAPRELTWPARLTIIQRHTRNAFGAAASSKVTVMLIRLGRQEWGPIPATPAEPSPGKIIPLTMEDAAGLRVAGTFTCNIHEFRLTPASGESFFSWPTFPSLVQMASAWLRRKAADAKDHTVLLGTVMPPETAVGLGIDAGQVDQSGWPAQLWPVVYAKSSGTMIVPNLNLGTTALAREPGGN